MRVEMLQRVTGGFCAKFQSGLIAAAIGVLAWSAPAQAAVIGVDMGAAANVETGFVGYSVGADGPGPKTTTFTTTDLASVPSGSIGMTVAGGTSITGTASLNERTRAAPLDSGSFTYSSLLRDRVVALGSTGGLFVELSGFAPNKTFELQAWGYDYNGSTGAKAGNFELFNRTNGANTSLGSFAATAGQAPVNDNSFSVTGTITSDAAGKILFQSVSNMDGAGILNGFVVTAVPEPSSAALVVLAIGTLACRRSRRSGRA